MNHYLIKWALFIWIGESWYKQWIIIEWANHYTNMSMFNFESNSNNELVNEFCFSFWIITLIVNLKWQYRKKSESFYKWTITLIIFNRRANSSMAIKIDTTITNNESFIHKLICITYQSAWFLRWKKEKKKPRCSNGNWVN